MSRRYEWGFFFFFSRFHGLVIHAHYFRGDSFSLSFLYVDMSSGKRLRRHVCTVYHVA